MPEPEHVCGIIVDAQQRLVLQVRPAHSRHAASQLTCFGGKREAGEGIVACLRRELAEELAWRPGPFAADGLDLWQAERWIARFISLRLPAGIIIRTEPGFCAVHAAVVSLPGLPLSPWHAAAITAWLAGQQRVEL